MHDALTVWRSKVPKPKRFVERAGDKGVINRRYIERCDFLRVAREVAQIFVVVKTQIANSIVDLCGAMNSGVVAVSEMNQIHTIFLRIDGSRLSPFLTIVKNNLIVVAAAVSS